ncbi:MAG: hypothetical protein ACREV9_08955 [Burkholderiales bacterium]
MTEHWNGLLNRYIQDFKARAFPELVTFGERSSQVALRFSKICATTKDESPWGEPPAKDHADCIPSLSQPRDNV